MEHNNFQQKRPHNDNSINTNNQNNNHHNNKTIGYIAILHVQDLCESIKDIYIKYSTNAYLKGNRAIKNKLLSPKDKDPIKKSGVIYWFKCDRLDCDDEYTVESVGTFGERYKEHLIAPSPIHGHQSTTGHPTTMDNFSIIGREGHGFTRTIRKSIYISIKKPTLNKNIGKYNLPHIWDDILINNQKLQTKHRQQHLEHQYHNITYTT